MLGDKLASVILFLIFIYGSTKNGMGKGASYQKAKHYWPMNMSRLIDVRGHSEAQTHPGVIPWKKTEQLGNVLELDGSDDFIKITGFKTKCITDPTECKSGLSIGFWLKVYGGKYILYGGQYGDESRGAGYKIYQNTEKRQFIVEVATRYRVWKAILHKIPTLNWFHFIFVWSEYHGIRIYIDGEWVLQSVETYSNPKSTWRNDQEIFIGRPDKFYEIGNFGRFEIGHLVIWDYALKNIEEAKQAYKSSVRYDPMTSNCCHKKITEAERCVTEPCYKFDHPTKCNKVLGNKECICTDIGEMAKGKCPNRKIQKCKDMPSRDCKKLARQYGYCDYFEQDMIKLCPASCKWCGHSTMPMLTTPTLTDSVNHVATELPVVSKFQPLTIYENFGENENENETSLDKDQDQFLIIYEEPNELDSPDTSTKTAKRESQDAGLLRENIYVPKPKAMQQKQANKLRKEVLIFSLVGCAAGIILLFLVSLYSWKVYRSKYTGAFVPPLKSSSMVEVDEYGDDKWTKKYIDSSYLVIKDVPPKKRALPVIPSKPSQPKYQPPEFD